jgi:hypothetical protein
MDIKPRSELPRQACNTIETARKNEILQKIACAIPAGEKFRVVLPNSPMILIGDVIVAVQDGIPSRWAGGLRMRPVVNKLTLEDIRREIARLHSAFAESFILDRSGTAGISSGDVTFQIHVGGKEYPADFCAVWRAKPTA